MLNLQQIEALLNCYFLKVINNSNTYPWLKDSSNMN